MKLNVPSLTMLTLLLVSTSLYCTDTESERKKDASLAAAITMPKEVTPEMAELIDQDAAAKLKAMLRKQEMTDTRVLGKALVWAAAQDKTKVAKLLLEQGADVNVTVEGEHALIIAVKKSNGTLFKDILSTYQIDSDRVVDTYDFIKESESSETSELDKTKLEGFKTTLGIYPELKVVCLEFDSVIVESISTVKYLSALDVKRNVLLSATKELSSRWREEIAKLPPLAIKRRLPLLQKQAQKYLRDQSSLIHILEALFLQAYLDTQGAVKKIEKEIAKDKDKQAEKDEPFACEESYIHLKISADQ